MNKFLFWQRNREREFSAELESHLDLHVADNVRAGMTPEEARRQALVALGGVEPAKERYRAASRLAWVDSLLKDVQFGIRAMRRNSGFTMLAIITLAVGLGATNTAFTIMNTVLIRDLPFEAAGRIVEIGIYEPENGLEMSFADFRDWERSVQSFTGIAAFDQANFNVSDNDQAPEQVNGAYVSARTFQVLRVRPVLGRDFTPDDDRPGALPVVMLGNRVWQTRYAGDAAVVGRTIRVNAQSATVIGVMPDGFEFPFANNIWLPLSMMRGIEQRPRDARSLGAIGRLADGTNRAEAVAELNRINDAIARDFPETNGRRLAGIGRFRPGIGGQWYVVFAALMTAVGLLLLVSCANVANLLLARSLQRAREVSIRASLGATRWRVVRQLLVESVMLSLVAGTFALLLSTVGVRILLLYVEQIGKPAWMDFSIDVTVFLFLALICVGAAIIFGVMPALYVSKRGSTEMLRQSGGRTATAGMWVRHMTGALVVAEVVLTVILCAGAVSMMRHLQAQRSLSRAIDTSNLLTLTVNLWSQKYPRGQDRIAFVRRLEERLTTAGTGSSIAIANARPYMGAGNARFSVDGNAPRPGEQLPAVQAVTIGSRYFEVLGLPLVRGRTITTDGGAAGNEVVVNEQFVEQFLSGLEPIGRSIAISLENSELHRLTIVGVVPTLQRGETGGTPLSRPLSLVYVPYQLNPSGGLVLLARSQMSTSELATRLREEVRALDPDLPLFNIRTLDDALSELLWVNRVFGGMFVIFAGMAVLIAAVGTYGVVAFTMTQRTQEVGIRMALGAQKSQLCWTMMRAKVAQISLGIVMGAGVAFLLLRLMGGLLVGRYGQDPMTLAVSGAFLLIVSVASMLWPVWRATSRSPVAALRYE